MNERCSENQRHFSRTLTAPNQTLLGHHHYPRPQSINVAFVLLEHFSMSAFTSVVDTLVTANLLTTQPLYNITTLSLQGQTCTSDLNLDIAVTGELNAHNPSHFNIVIVCGGYRCALADEPQLTRFLKTADKNAAMLGGLWNGSYFLLQADVMRSCRYTVHPENRALLTEHYPNSSLSLLPYIIDNERFSCAGASSASEMMLAMVEKQFDKQLSSGVKEILMCDKIGEVANQPMLAASHTPTLPKALKAILKLMENNIDEPLSMAEIAQYVSLSKRQIERLFVRYLETTPSKYYLELRITRSRQLLLQTNQSVAAVAVACGFVSIPHFSRCFKDYFGCSPMQARQGQRAG